MLEPLEQIFTTLPKPQRGSTFSFTGLAECDIILWQDYEHHEDTLCFTDLLSTLCGEAFGVRVPGRPNAKCRNVAPAFYSGRTPMMSSHRDVTARAELNSMMNERFHAFGFSVPLPMHMRVADWPACGRCAAVFYLHGPAQTPAATNAAQGSVEQTAAAREATGSTVVADLCRLVELKTAGLLSEGEFQAAKAARFGGGLSS